MQTYIRTRIESTIYAYRKDDGIGDCIVIQVFFHVIECDDLAVALTSGRAREAPWKNKNAGGVVRRTHALLLSST